MLSIIVSNHNQVGPELNTTTQIANPKLTKNREEHVVRSEKEENLQE